MSTFSGNSRGQQASATPEPAFIALFLQGLQLSILKAMAADPSRAWSGQDFVNTSSLQFKSGSVYVTLQRMQNKGLLVSVRELPREDCAVVRRLYTLSPHLLEMQDIQAMRNKDSAHEHNPGAAS